MSKLTRIFAMLIVAICGLIFFYVSAGDGDSANPPAAATTVSVSSVSYATEGGKNKDKHLLITVALVDDLLDAVANASVSVDLFRDLSFIASGTSTTGAGGSVTFTLKNAEAGCYTTVVTDVTAAGLTWDETTAVNEFCK